MTFGGISRHDPISVSINIDSIKTLTHQSLTTNNLQQKSQKYHLRIYKSYLIHDSKTSTSSAIIF